jgi:hypothetical protein
MAERILGEEGSRRRWRFRFLILPLLIGAALALMMAGGAQAVHEDGVFQLDGNAKVADNSTPAEPAATEDADNICAKFAVVDATNAAGLKCNVASAAALAALPAATASTRAAWVTDGSGPFASQATDDQYTGGSEDDNDVSSWKFKNAASSNDKSDIENAFLAEYTKTIGGVTHKLAYFGGDRSSNNGDENTAFWLFQQKVSEAGDNADGTCSKSAGCGFNGVHTPGIPGNDSCYEIRPGVGVNISANNSNSVSCTESATETDQKGDILIVSAFTTGGTQPNIQAYVWMGYNAAGTKGAINPKSGLCVTSACTVLKVFDSSSPGCDPLVSGDIACAITNQPVQYATCPASGSCIAGNTIPTPSPWVFKDVALALNAGFAAGDYFEAGLDLTLLGLGNECTSTFTMNTRSSQSVNASLQDLAIGQVGSCVSGTGTTPQGSTDGGTTFAPVDETTNALTIPTAASGSSPLQVRDRADITVQGGSGSFGGSVSFYLCGPSTTNTTNCNDPTPFSDTTDDPGVLIGSAVSVTGSGGAATVFSTPATLTSVGYYCWRAVYSGDASKNVPGSSDPSNATSRTECFRVKPVAATLVTNASCSPLTGTDCILGATLSDTATLSGTAYAPGTNGVGPGGTINATDVTNPALGSITWHAYGPNSCSTIAAFGATGTSRDVSGDGTYPTASQTAVSFVPTAVGDYVFVATYSGNSPNTSAPTTTATCASPGANETITVKGTASSASKQRWLPNDRVVLTGDTNLNGTLDITLYKDADCGAGANEGAADIVYTEPQITVTNAASGTAFNTTNSAVFVGTKPDGSAGLPVGSYSWLVHYNDTTLTDPADRCETTTFTSITDSP